MMRPVQQRRPRRGADFVLPDVPMLDSPDWSDEEAESRPNRSPSPAHVAAVAPPPRPMNAPPPPHYPPGVLPPGVAPYYSPIHVQRIAQASPPAVSGVRYSSPGLPRVSPFVEHQQQQQQQQQQPTLLFGPGVGGGGRQGRRAGPDSGFGGVNPYMPAEMAFKARVETLRADGGGGRARKVNVRGDAQRRREEEEEEEDKEMRVPLDREDLEGESEERDQTSPSHLAIGSFACPIRTQQARFGGGSLFVARRRDDDEDVDGESDNYDYVGDAGEEEEEEDDEGSSLDSRTAARAFFDDGGSSDDSESGHHTASHRRRRHHRTREDAESIIAPSFVGGPPPPEANGPKKELRKPSLFVISAADSNDSHYYYSDEALSVRQNQANRNAETSAAPSIFNRFLMDRDEESPNNHLAPGTSTVFVGPQSVRLERSNGPGMYTYGGLQHAPQQQQQQQQQQGVPPTQPYPSTGVSEPLNSSDGGAAAVAHNAFANRHGTFLLSTDETSRPSPHSARSPVGHVSVQPSLPNAGTSSPLHLSTLSPVHTVFGLAPARPVPSSERRRSSGAHTGSRSHSLDGNQSTSSNHDYDGMRDSGSVAPTPAVPKAAPRPNSRSDSSGDESEEERYEQTLRSRFCHSLNSRLILRKAAELEATHPSNSNASMMWQGGGNNAASVVGEDEVVVFAPTSGQRESALAARGVRGTSVTGSAPPSASPNAERLNFYSRIAPRQQQPPVQPLSRFPPTYVAPAVPTSNAGKRNSSTEGDATAPPNTTSLAVRRGLHNGGGESFAFSMEAQMLKSVAATPPISAEGGAGVTVAKSSSMLSTMAAMQLGGFEADEYGLMYFIGSPSGPRRTSTVSVEDPAATNRANGGANTGGAFSSSSSMVRPPHPGPHRSAVMPISLQPSLIASTRRPIGAVTVVSPSEGVGNGPVGRRTSTPTPQLTFFPLEPSSAPPSSAGEIPSPPLMPCAPSSAPVIRTSLSEGHRLSGGAADDDAPQWTPNDDLFYFQAGDYTPVAGAQAASPSITRRAERSPSFSGYRNSNYFLLNSFRSSTASPQGERAEDAAVQMAPMPTVAMKSNSNSGVLSRANPARGGLSAALPSTYQKRLSGASNENGREVSLTRAPALAQEAVSVVARSPRAPSKALSGLSIDAAHGLGDYGFPEEPDCGATGLYYGMDDDAYGFGYVPMARPTDAPAVRQPAPTAADRASDAPAQLPDAHGTTTVGSSSRGVSKNAQRRQRLSTSSAEEPSPYYSAHTQHRRNTSRETLRTVPPLKDAKGSKVKGDRAEEQSSKASRSRALSTTSGVVPSRPKPTLKGAKIPTSPTKPPSHRLDSFSSFTPLHATEQAVHTNRQATTKQ